MTDLTKMFNPDSVAIVGASNSEGKVGYIIVNNMINDGFKGVWSLKSKLYDLLLVIIWSTTCHNLINFQPKNHNVAWVNKHV